MINKIQIKRKTLSPKLDIVFQALFGEEGSERITRDLLQTIIGEKITDVNLSKNPILRRDKIDDKLGVLDIVAKINGKENCDIEMQIVQEENIIERILFYWAKLYTRELKKGENYGKLEKTIIILILDKEIINLKELKEYHTEWKIIDSKTRRIILTDKLELHIIMLDKIKDIEAEDDKLLNWMKFLINPESEGVKKIMEENGAIREAKEKLDKISEDEKMQQLAWWREKAVYEENTRINSAYKKGEKAGIEKRNIEIAKKLKQESASIELIMKVTGLTKEEIEKI